MEIAKKIIAFDLKEAVEIGREAIDASDLSPASLRAMGAPVARVLLEKMDAATRRALLVSLFPPPITLAQIEEAAIAQKKNQSYHQFIRNCWGKDVFVGIPKLASRCGCSVENMAREWCFKFMAADRIVEKNGFRSSHEVKVLPSTAILAFTKHGSVLGIASVIPGQYGRGMIYLRIPRRAGAPDDKERVNYRFCTSITPEALVLGKSIDVDHGFAVSSSTLLLCSREGFSGKRLLRLENELLELFREIESIRGTNDDE